VPRGGLQCVQCADLRSTEQPGSQQRELRSGVEQPDQLSADGSAWSADYVLTLRGSPFWVLVLSSIQNGEPRTENPERQALSLRRRRTASAERDAPDLLPAIVGHQQRSVGKLQQAHRPAPDLLLIGRD